MWQGKEAKKGGRVKRLDLNLLIGQQHLNDLNISFNARPNTGGFLAPFYIQGRGFFCTHAHVFTTKYNKFQHVYPLILSAFFSPTHMAVCLLCMRVCEQLPLSRILSSSVCVAKCVRNFFGHYFHYFRTETVLRNSLLFRSFSPLRVGLVCSPLVVVGVSPCNGTN